MPRGEDVFVRFYTRFILEDPRFLRHSLGARAVFLHLSSMAVAQRNEFLPVRYDAESLAVGMRCTEAEVDAGLEELIAAKREALVGRLSDGRLRIVDVRKCHGEKFRWHDETEAFEAWAAEFGPYARAVSPYGDNRGQQGTNAPDSAVVSPLVPEVRGKRREVRDRAGERANRARATPDAANDNDVKDLESFDAEAVSGVADADLPTGARTDAPTQELNGTAEATEDSGNAPGSGANSQDVVEHAMAQFRLATRNYGERNGAMKARRQAEGRARDLAKTHEGRIAIVGSALEKSSWGNLAKRLGKTGPPPDVGPQARASAKRALGMA